MAPAASSGSSTAASAVGRKSRNAGVPPVVGRSFVLMLSLTSSGNPASGPSGEPAARTASISAAAARAPSRFSVMTAFSSAS